MKYHIDTIPVWDALKAGGECPLCALRRKTERLLVERSLGGSVMSPDTRKKVNDAGFCGRHQQMMFHDPKGNRLGQALMLLSYLQHQRPLMEKVLKSDTAVTKRPGLLARKLENSQNAISQLGNFTTSCLLCEELRLQSQRQCASLLHLWKTEQPFREAFTSSLGLCLPDTELALSMSRELLSGDMQTRFSETARSLLRDSLKRLEEELTWFTQKFDYRNSDKPWGTSRDALERSVNKLRGWVLGPEPLQDDR